jgi:membrane-associated phospholipid phosphatase
MDPLTSGSLDLIRAFQSLGGWLVAPMRLLSFLGTEEFYMLVVPLVFWCINRTLGIELVALLLASTGLNELAKGLLKLPRPFWIEPKLALSTETSFGLPSGHAQNVIVLWGYLATVLRSPWRWLCVLLIFLISLSRLYLGVHFPGDVLAGWALGLLVLGAFLWLKPRLNPRLSAWSLGRHVLAAILVSAAVLFLYLTAATIPAGEPARFGDLFSVAHAQVVDAAGSIAGMILGAWIGLAIEERRVRFSTAGTFWQRTLRLIIGLLIVVLLRFGLSAILSEDTLVLGLAFRTLRYALMMLWVALAWPWLFVRLGLAQRESS